MACKIWKIKNGQIWKWGVKSAYTRFPRISEKILNSDLAAEREKIAVEEDSLLNDARWGSDPPRQHSEQLDTASRNYI